MEYDLAINEPGQGPRAARFTFRATPLVSCLMVTRGDTHLMAQAIGCFQAQTYGHRELIVTCEAGRGGVAQFVAGLNDPSIRYLAGPDAPLGALRNASLSAARGPIVCQWDDDDLYDPQRLELMVSVLASTKVDAAFLARITLWWPAQRRLAISEARLWEGSMVAIRNAVPPYPEYRRGEDSAMLDVLRARARTAVLDAPGCYVYRITGQNTWDSPHFDSLFARASQDLTLDYDARVSAWPAPP